MSETKARVLRGRSPNARWLAWLGVTVALGLAAFALGRCTAPEGSTHGHEGAGGEQTVWTCSMHPQVRQPEPGQCPICGMDLIPLEGGGEAQLAPNQVTMSDRSRTLAQLRTTDVRRLSASGATLRMLGRVDYDETTLQTVTAWVGGRIDRLHVRVTGERLRRGQVVASLYSPEIYAAHQDLMTAKAQLERLRAGSEIARASAEATLASARERLRLLGVPDAEIERMEEHARPTRNVAIRSPFAGTVLERLASEGAYVQTGTPLYRVADLTRLWVQLDAYESDLAHLEVGQVVELDVEALPGETFEGRIAFIDPVVDARRRTARVRVEVSNPERRLRPGMFVEAVLHGGEATDAAQPLVIPASAALFTGRRSVVYVAVSDALQPTYEARVVRLAPQVGDLFPVVAGLSEGERVVSQGAFALDADLQIRGGESMMMGGDDTTPGPYDLAQEVPEAWDQALRPVVEAYLRMQERLAEDDLSGAREHARAIVAAVAAVDLTEPRAASEAWQPLAEHLRMHGTRAAEAATIEEARGQFEHLGRQIATLLSTFGNPTDVALRLAFCPMAFDNRGAEWVQASEGIDNAYFGAAMRTCGSIRATVEPHAYLPARSED